MTLVRQGVRSQEAYAAVQQYYGPPKSAEDQARDAANQQQNAALIGTAGTITGLIGAKLVYDWASGLWKNTNTGEEVSKPIVEAAFKAEGIPYSQSGSLTITRPVPPPTTVVDGSQAGVLDLSGNTTTIDTPNGQQEVPSEIANDSEFLKTVDWNQIAQGAQTLMAAYTAYRLAKEKDYTGAALYGTYAGLGGASLAGSATASAAMPYAGPVVGAYGAYKTADYVGDAPAGSQRTKSAAAQGAVSGALIGSYFGPIGTAIGAAVGGLGGAVASWTGSKKSAHQQQRDKVRSVLKDSGILDKDYLGTLADGTKFDFGKDGKFLEWRTIDKIAEERPKEWDEAVKYGHVISATYGLSGQDLSEMTKWWGRAAVENSGGDLDVIKQNMRHFAQQQGLTYEQLQQNVQKRLEDNQISQEQADRYLRDGQDLFNVNSQPAGQQANATIPIRPEEGAALRVSPGLYRIDTGELMRAKTLRDALEQAYGKSN